MSEVYIVIDVQEVDGGYLPDNRRIQGVFSSRELAQEYIDKNEKDYDNLTIDEYEVDEE